MKKSLLCMAALLGALAMPSHAALVGFGNEFSGGTDCANAVSGCAVLSVTSIAGGVHYRLTGTMTGTEFVTGLYGNFAPFALPTSISDFTGSGATSFNGLTIGENSFKADGDGFFDWFLDLSSSPPRFTDNDVIEWDFMGITLAQAFDGISVNGPEGKTGFNFALRAQGLADGGSGWFSNTPPPPICVGCEPDPQIIPAPGTLALAGLGLLGLAFTAKGKRKVDPEPDEDEEGDDK